MMNKDLEPLTLQETALKEAMKYNCLNKGLYIDKYAEEKFKMLCHLEDFEVAYLDLQQRIDKVDKYIDRLLNTDDPMYLDAVLITIRETLGGKE